MRFLVRAKPKSDPEAVRVGPIRLRLRARPMRVLDFDLENRPLSYLGSDFTTGEITALCWAWTDKPEHVTVYLLGDVDLPTMLDRFVEAYNEADLVTGHYILGHDLGYINGALMELGKPGLSDKYVQDTKVHLMRTKGISLSQESLAAMAQIEEQKVKMTQAGWREANRLTNKGLALVRDRVVGDVKQHQAMRRWLIARGYVGPAKLWRSHSQQPVAPYTA